MGYLFLEGLVDVLLVDENHRDVTINEFCDLVREVLVRGDENDHVAWKVGNTQPFGHLQIIVPRFITANHHIPPRVNEFTPLLYTEVVLRVGPGMLGKEALLMLKREVLKLRKCSYVGDDFPMDGI